MTHVRRRTAAALVTGWLVACSSPGALAHSVSANEFNSLGSCAAMGNSVAEGVWQWCAKNEKNNMNGCKASFRSWVREVERTCDQRRREFGCSPSDYDAVEWHMHGWKRPGQKLSLHRVVRDCEEETQGQASGAGAGGAAPALDHEARRRVQSALAAQGFDPGQPDGKFGPKTRGAIQAWQQANGHAATGELTTGQVEQLLSAESPPGASATGAAGDLHGSIGTGSGTTGTPAELDEETRRRVQTALAAQGFDPEQPDGKFGPRTRGAIQAWQQANGYAATGELTGEQVERLLAAESPPGSAGTAATGKPNGSRALPLEFPCEGGRAKLESRKWKVQNYQNYSQEYKASTHLLLAYCQMALGDPRGALKNFKVASDMGRIIANYLIANYYLTGGHGQDEAEKDSEKALWEFEKTLQRINAVGADYPNTDLMAGDEITTRIYPNTLLALIQQGTNRYLVEGYGFYDGTPPTYYDDPAKAIQRNQANKDMLDRVESHMESCLADHEGQNMMFRASTSAQRF